MSGGRLGARFETGGQAVVQMLPMVRADVFWRDPVTLHNVDSLKSRFDLRPASRAQQNLRNRRETGNRAARLTDMHKAQSVDPTLDGAVVVRPPTHEGKDRPGAEASHFSVFVKMVSSASWPKRIQRSICPSIH